MDREEKRPRTQAKGKEMARAAVPWSPTCVSMFIHSDQQLFHSRREREEAQVEKSAASN